MKSPFVTFTVLDASTAHLTPQTRKALDHNAVDGVLYYPKGPWGWFVHVPTPEDGMEFGEGAPEDLQHCIKLAQQQGFHWIMFDADGSCVDELPLYTDEANQALEALVTSQ